MFPYRPRDLPVGSRPYAELEVVLEAQLSTRNPLGTGEWLAFFRDGVPYIAIPKDDLSGWEKRGLFFSDNYIADGKVIVGKTGNTPVAVEQRDYKYTELLDVDDTDRIAHSVGVWNTGTSKHEYLPFDLEQMGDVDITGRGDRSLLSWDVASNSYKPLHLLTTDLTDIDTAARADGKTLAWQTSGSKHVYIAPPTVPALLSSKVEITTTAAYASELAMTWDAETRDDLSGFNLAVDSHFRAPVTGLYMHIFNISRRVSSGAGSLSYFYLGGSTGYITRIKFAATSSFVTQSWVTVVPMTAGNPHYIAIAPPASTTLEVEGAASGMDVSTWEVIRVG